MKKSLILAVVLVAGCALFQGPPTSEPDPVLDGWKQASADARSEYGALKADLVVVTDPVERAKMEKRLGELEPIIAGLDAAVQNAETRGDVGWGLLETGLASASAAGVPFAGWAWILARLLRRKKKALKGTFDTIRASGGPADPAKAKEAMKASPEARAEYVKWKNGG
ncbi:MAG: hypothetical protein ACYSVY_29665 [Planctomycetota bacterium]|jgi:hypothetical protein